MPVFLAFAVLIALLVAITFAWPLRKTARGSFVGIVIAMPLLAVGLYQVIGAPAALAPAARKPLATMQDAIAQLEVALQRNPQQVQGWRLLGRAYADQTRSKDARNALARAATLAPDDSDAQAEYAESRAKANADNRFDAEAVAILERTLERDPKHQRTRWFLGIAQRQAGDSAKAATTWQPLLTQVDAATAAALRPQIDAARRDAGLPPLPAPQPAAIAASSTNAITVKVSLDPGFAARARLRGDSSVFVIARAPGGPPMPVAVEKHPLQALPLTVTLGDDDSPMPTQALSSLQEVELIARLSASGNAMKQDGDLDSAPVRIALPAQGPVELVIGGASR
ncbi:MAG: tetratricopeptide repeat protein [Luteimonas sp.]